MSCYQENFFTLLAADFRPGAVAVAEDFAAGRLLFSLPGIRSPAPLAADFGPRRAGAGRVAPYWTGEFSSDQFRGLFFGVFLPFLRSFLARASRRRL